MPLRDDLAAAAAAGIISAEQAARLDGFIAARSPAGATPPAASRALAEDESVRFVRSFHDVFMTIGIVLLLVGVGIAGPMALGPVIGTFAGAVVAFALAGVFARRRRLVLPSIALAAGFTLFTGVGTAILLGAGGWEVLFGRGPKGWDVPFLGGVAAFAASSVFYAAFRLPFALALMALSTVVASVAVLAMVADDAFVSILYPALLALGLGVFVLAMLFDLGDPIRRTIRADNAFWLHLVAAPLIVHSVVSMLIERSRFSFTPSDAAVVFGVVAVLGLIALAIDRRAILVAALSYLGFAIATLMRETEIGGTGVAAVTLILLGAFVVMLGAGWQPLRSSLLSLFPRRGPLARLPPFGPSTP